MSDDYQQYGDYEEYGDYSQAHEDYEMPAEQQDYETKVELDYFQAEQLLRKDHPKQCLQSLEQLYDISTQHSLKNWKPKILNLMLQIYCRAQDLPNIRLTLQRISQLNQTERYTETAIKSIVMTIKSLPHESFKISKEIVYGFVNQLDPVGKVRSFLLFLQKAVEEDDQQEAQRLITLIKSFLKQTANIPASNLIELYSYEIVLAKRTNKAIDSQLHKIHLQLPQLQTESYMSEGHIAVIKQAIAEQLYLEENYIECSLYLREAFEETMKYGKVIDERKNILKTNVLVALLIGDKEYYLKDKYNALYHESAVGFKSETDVQALYGLVQAFVDCDFGAFVEQTQLVMYHPSKSYTNLVDKVITHIKTTKLLQVIKPYTTVRLSYLARRLDIAIDQVQSIVFGLIIDRVVVGRIRREENEATGNGKGKGKGNEAFLDLANEQDEMLDIQLQNVQELAKRYV